MTRTLARIPLVVRLRARMARHRALSGRQADLSEAFSLIDSVAYRRGCTETLERIRSGELVLR